MAAAVMDIIVGLYKAIARQEKVVGDQEEGVELLNEANIFLDVERLTGVIMREAKEQLAAARGVLEDLYAQLDWALDLWSRTVTSDDDEELPVPNQPRSADPTPSQPIVEESKHHSAPPDLDDPRVGSLMRHTQQWQEWIEAPTIHNPSILDLSRPTPWWMEEQNQYGLCQPEEQDLLENSARAAQFNRAHALAPSPTPSPARLGPFGQEVRQAQQRRFLSSALPIPPVPGAQLSHNRWARSGSEDFWLDEDFDPKFWQKNLRPGNIWTEPRRSSIPEDDDISPLTAPLRLVRRDQSSARAVPAINDIGGSHAERTLRVGGTSPAD